MRTSRNQQLGLLAGAAILICGIQASAASAATVAADLRVLTDSGRVLTDVRQYTDTTAVPTSPQAKCFFMGKGGSGKPATVTGPTALGAVADAARSSNDLSPILVTDEYSFGLGICGFGGVSAASDFSNFWQVRVDHKATQKGGDQVAVSNGDDVLWSLVPAPVCNPPDYTVCAPTPPELVLDAPARAKTGQPFAVTVSEFNDSGFQKPAAGVAVTGATAPTDAGGKTMVTLAAPGSVTATRAGSIRSRTLPVCINAKLKRCPTARGLPIFGSELADAILGTEGPDTIKAGGGDDAVGVRNGARDHVQCGAGTDSVRADRRDIVDKRSCEKVKRFGKKKRRKKGGGGKGGGRKGAAK